MNNKTISQSKDIGAIVRDARKRIGITQSKAAAMCGVGTRFLSELENGKSTLQIGKVLIVLRNFGYVITVKRKGIVQ